MLLIGKFNPLLSLYRYWLTYGGTKPPGYRENLCHFCRVVFVWVPLLWFFRVPFYKWVRPWMVTIGALAGVLYGVFWSLAPTLTLGATLLTLAVIAASGLLLALLFGVIYYSFEYNIFPAIGRALRWTFRPIGRFFTRPIGRFFTWLADVVLVPTLEFLFGRVPLIGAPATLIPVALVIALYFSLPLTNFLITLAYLGGLVGVCVVVIAIGLLLVFLVEKVHIQKKIASGVETVAIRPFKRLTIFGVIWQFAKAKKRMVCPFIEFENID